MKRSRENTHIDTLRLSATFLVLAGCAFLWIALLTHDPYDAPGSLAWPPNDPPRNGCGTVGAWAAWHALRYFGVGAYAVLAVISAAAATRLLNDRIPEWPLRAGGALMLIAVACSAGRMLLGGPEQGRLIDGGGVVGIALADYLTQHLSRAGTMVLLLAAAMIGLLLVADELILRVPDMIRRAGTFGRLAWAGTMDSDEGVRRRVAAAGRKSMLSGATWLRSSIARAWRGVEEWLEVDNAGDAEAEAPHESNDGGAGDRNQQAAAPARKREADAATSVRPVDPDPADADSKAAPDEDAARAVVAAEKPSSARKKSVAETAAQTPAAPVEPAEAAPAVAEVRSEPISKNSREAAAEKKSETAPPAAAAKYPAPPAGPVVRSLGQNAAAQRSKPPVSPWPRELGDYVLPSIDLLAETEYSYSAAQESVVRDKAQVLERTLQEFRVDARVVAIDTGPVITMYELSIAPGIKVSQIASLSNDIARALKAPAVRVVAPLPNKNTIGIEVPNADKEKVRIKELITLGGVKPTRMALPVFLGKDASGQPLISDLAAMPHLLIAGTTGSGKSVCINTLIMSVLMTQRPDHVKLILVDPKMVELSSFKDVPHLMCPIVTDMTRAEAILEWAATKMDERYELLAEAGVRHIVSFNRMTKEEIYERFNPSNDEERAKIPTHLPYIVIIIDELADLMMTSGKTVEHHLCRLAQKSRAVGIHVILATQRPQANVVTGLIKSNLPSRIAFRVASRMDSRIVLDQNGAEVLMGQGDMLFLPPGSSKLLRAQGTYLEDDELKRVLDDLRSKAQPEFHHELVRIKPASEPGSGERDPLFDQAVDIILETRRGSVSLLQRRLEVGYTRASRLVDQMYEAGIVGEYKGSQSREVIMTKEEWAALKGHRTREEAAGYAADDPNDGRYAVADETGDALEDGTDSPDDAAEDDADSGGDDESDDSDKTAAESEEDE